MSALDHLHILDLSDTLAAIPRRPGHTVLAPRGPEAYITLHYSAVVYRDRSRTAELARIRAEATDHVQRDWGRPGQPAYGDGYMYDFVVLSEDGTIVRTRRRRQRLWHCNNRIGNARSWSAHVMLGPGQDLTPPQAAALIRLFDALRADAQGRIPHTHVVGHCEWPLLTGEPVPTPTYQPQPQQSACPGSLLMTHVIAYRAAGLGPAPTGEVGVSEEPRTYVVRVDVARVRAQPNTHPTTRILARLQRGAAFVGTPMHGEAYPGGTTWIRSTVAGYIRGDLLQEAA